jgi:hypothetical protein
MAALGVTLLDSGAKHRKLLSQPAGAAVRTLLEPFAGRALKKLADFTTLVALVFINWHNRP